MTSFKLFGTTSNFLGELGQLIFSQGAGLASPSERSERLKLIVRCLKEILGNACERSD